MSTFLNNTRVLWKSILILQLLIIISYILFFQLRLVNPVLFFIPTWIAMAFTVEFIYLLHQKTLNPDHDRTFGAGWYIWIGILLVNIGIALFFFNAFWLAAVYALVPLTLGYLVYMYGKVFSPQPQSANTTPGSS